MANEWSATLSDGSSVSVWETDRPDPYGEPRISFAWIIMSDEFLPISAGYDLRSGCNFHPKALEMASVLAGFISAWVESFAYPESENRDLFPDEMRVWAEANSEELFALTYTDEAW